ncbi:hypothetical protein ACQCU3_12700 [Bacillus altitudinis]|uniref:hypothetical protein n=1 Tax=Bacillus altitudinis TaxID=293387 RepID=UPI0011E8BD47|nr:hypothetical protein [Bacillus altitudinis]TYS26968.1 hypothetical protein FZC69_13785 [Bacillus altitudinis]
MRKGDRMYCVTEVNEFYGDYGSAASYYVRETANGIMDGLFNDGAAHIKLEVDCGAFVVTNNNGEIYVRSTNCERDFLALLKNAVSSAHLLGANEVYVLPDMKNAEDMIEKLTTAE